MKIKQTNKSHIPGIEVVEFERYAILYSEHPEKKELFGPMMKKRINIAQQWMWVLVEKDRVLGALSAQPTSKGLDDFVSWEVSTNNGTLEGTYMPEGRNVYVVNLDALREATKRGGQYMLMAHLAAKVLATNKDIVFFESRMPGFREWMTGTMQVSFIKWGKLTSEEKQQWAEKYASTKIQKNGKNVSIDRLLRFYQQSGFKAHKIIPEAFDDPESMNFGVVFYAKNPLPKILRLPLIRHTIAAFIRLFSKSPRILDLLT